MLSYAQLAELERRTRESLVLNVYIDATELDGVARRSWRHTLANAVVATRKSLADAPHAERTAFDRAAERLEARTMALSDDMDGAPGWVAFATADEILYAGPTTTVPAASLVWRKGIAMVPYVRLLRDEPTVTVAQVDVRKADIYRWVAGTLHRVERVQAHAHVGRAGHMGDAPHPGFHSGTRGTTLTDAAQRAMDAGVDRMVRDVAAQIGTTGLPGGWIILVGNRTVALDTIKHLTKGEQKCAVYVPGLAADAAEPEIAHAAAEGRAQLQTAHEVARVVDLIERAAASDRAVLGYTRTLEALAAGAAREVLVTGDFFARETDRAEALMLAVLANGAHLVEVGGEGAARLDAECEGVGATLRFRTQPGRATLEEGAVVA